MIMSGREQIWGADIYSSAEWADEISLTREERQIAVHALEDLVTLGQLIFRVAGTHDYGRSALVTRVGQAQVLLERLKYEKAA